MPEEQVTADIRQFKVKGIHPGLHPSLNSTSVPILALDININTNKIVTGRADKKAMVFNKETETKLQLKGHTKLVNRVVYHINNKGEVQIFVILLLSNV